MGVIWQPGDLVVTVDGLSGDKQPLLAAWGMDGTFRGMNSLAPPLNVLTSNAPVLPTFKPDGSRFYAWLEVGVPTEFDNRFVFGNGDIGDLDWDYLRSLGQGVGQDFDDAGNRYMGNYDGVDDYILKESPEGATEEFRFSLSDPNINSGRPTAIQRLHVNSGGTIAYWNSDPVNMSATSNFIGFNRIDLANNSTLPFFDLQLFVESATRMADFVVGPVTGRIYISYEGTNGFPFIAVIDPDSLEILNIYPPGDNKCVVHGLAISCDETQIAALHSDVGIDDIEIFDPFTGTPIRLISYIEDMGGRQLIRGMAYAPCPPTGRFFGFVTLIGAT